MVYIFAVMFSLAVSYVTYKIYFDS